MTEIYCPYMLKYLTQYIALFKILLYITNCIQKFYYVSHGKGEKHDKSIYHFKHYF